MKKETKNLIFAGIIIGAIASILVYFGNPKNMGFCIACFLRDTAGALGLQRAIPVQYIRPELIGLVIGSLIMAIMNKEFSPKGGSSTFTRFTIGFFVMIGALMFLGCPFRMILRLAGGDGNAILGLVGFILGIASGIFFISKGYSLKRTYKMEKQEGYIFPIIQIILLILVTTAPAFIFFTPKGKGPGAMHAAIIISLLAGIVVGALAQRTRLCMIGGIRDILLFKDFKLISGFIAILVSAFVVNIILTLVTKTPYFNPGFVNEPIAMTDGLWNFLGMFLVGYGCVLIGGCPLRQMIMSGEGNIDSVITVVGIFIGGAFAHNFGLASSPKGPTFNGKIAVIIGIIVITYFGIVNTFGKKDN